MELEGRYRLDRLAGTGGTAEIWHGSDRLLHRPVAVRIPHFSGAALADRFLGDGRIAARLVHANIAAVYDIGVADLPERGPTPYVVLELADGPSLDVRLDPAHPDGPLPWREAAQIGAQVAAALAHAHGQWVAHGGLTPAKILLGDVGAKIVGFAGDTEYNPAAAAADVRALGVVLAGCVGGRVGDAVPAELFELVDRCLSIDATARPSSDEAALILGELSGTTVDLPAWLSEAAESRRTAVLALRPDTPRAAARSDRAAARSDRRAAARAAHTDRPGLAARLVRTARPDRTAGLDRTVAADGAAGFNGVRADHNGRFDSVGFDGAGGSDHADRSARADRFDGAGRGTRSGSGQHASRARGLFGGAGLFRRREGTTGPRRWAFRTGAVAVGITVVLAGAVGALGSSVNGGVPWFGRPAEVAAVPPMDTSPTAEDVAPPATADPTATGGAGPAATPTATKTRPVTSTTRATRPVTTPPSTPPAGASTSPSASPSVSPSAPPSPSVSPTTSPPSESAAPSDPAAPVVPVQLATTSAAPGVQETSSETP